MKAQKKLLAILLAVVMVLAMTPAMAFADDGIGIATRDYDDEFAQIQEDVAFLEPRLSEKLPLDYLTQISDLSDAIDDYKAALAAKEAAEESLANAQFLLEEAQGEADSAQTAFNQYLRNTELTFASKLELVNDGTWSYETKSLRDIIIGGYTITIFQKIPGGKVNEKTYELIAPYDRPNLNNFERVLAYLTAIADKYNDGTLYSDAFAKVTKPPFAESLYDDDEWAALKASVEVQYQNYFTNLVANIVAIGPALANATAAAKAALADAEAALTNAENWLADREADLAAAKEDVEQRIDYIRGWVDPLLSYVDTHTVLAAIGGTPDSVDLKPGGSFSATYPVVVNACSDPLVQAKLTKFNYDVDWDPADAPGIFSVAPVYTSTAGKLTLKAANAAVTAEVSATVKLSATLKDSGGNLTAGKVLAVSPVTGTDNEYTFTYQKSSTPDAKWFIVIAPKEVTMTVWPKMTIASDANSYTVQIGTDSSYIDNLLDIFDIVGGKPDFSFSISDANAANTTPLDSRITINEFGITVPKDTNSTPNKTYDKDPTNLPYKFKVTVTDAKGDVASKTITLYVINAFDAKYKALTDGLQDLSDALAAAKATLEGYPDGAVDPGLLEDIAQYTNFAQTIKDIWNDGFPTYEDAGITKKEAIELIEGLIPEAEAVLEEAEAAVEDLSPLVDLMDARNDLEDWIGEYEGYSWSSLYQFYDDRTPPATGYYVELAEKLAAVQAAAQAPELAAVQTVVDTILADVVSITDSVHGTIVNETVLPLATEVMKVRYAAQPGTWSVLITAFTTLWTPAQDSYNAALTSGDLSEVILSLDTEITQLKLIQAVAE